MFIVIPCVVFVFSSEASWRLPSPIEGFLQGCHQVYPLPCRYQTTCLRKSCKRKVCWLSLNSTHSWCKAQLLYHKWMCLILSLCVKCPPTLQQENGSSCRQSATQKRESLALWMLRRKTCHLSMSARSSGTMETWRIGSFVMTRGSTLGKDESYSSKWVDLKVEIEVTECFLSWVTSSDVL